MTQKKWRLPTNTGLANKRVAPPLHLENRCDTGKALRVMLVNENLDYILISFVGFET